MSGSQQVYFSNPEGITNILTRVTGNNISNIFGPLAVDGKVLRGSYLLSEDNPHCEPHQALTLVSAYLVERGLILRPEQVKNQSNEISAVPRLIEALTLKDVVVAFDAMNTQKKQ